MFCWTSRGSSSFVSDHEGAQVAGEHVELLQVGILEGQDLGEKGVECGRSR